jgi:serine/threonine-protein kinase
MTRDQFVAGDEVGAYRITRLLGRGGMGAVYEGERADGAFEKKVAIKIVKRGMDTDEIVRRFHHERRILARLEHPNIAGIMDGGITEDGLPYFVMELAQGERIDEFCDNHTLLILERLELFEQVCQAVQYAHGNLVVHRDIKPGNIVVAEDGVKLLDFGIAKLLGPEDSPIITQVHDTRLTPQYAAPEQVRNQATTTATDVYSLGVLLYELLCGRPPYRLGGMSLLEMQQVIGHTDPIPPSAAVTRWKDGAVEPEEIARRRGIGRAATLQLQLRGDLDAICLKALAKTPDGRYVSAAALADDIRRHLNGLAVQAHPPTRAYQIRKFVRRNRRSVTLGTAAGAAVLVALVSAIVLGRQAARERDLRQAEAERATAARDFIIGTLASFDPDARPGQLEFSAHDLVLRGQDNLNRLDVQPPLKASVMNTLGQVAFNLGERAIADSLFRAAHDILEASGGGPDLAVSMHGIGQVLQRDRRFSEAVDWYGRSLDLRRRIGANPTTIAASQQALAFALYNVGEPDALDEAERLYRELLTWPDSMWMVRAGAIEGLADISAERGNLTLADSLYTEGLAVRMAHQSHSHPDVARMRWGHVYVNLRVGRPEVAERMSRDIISTLEQAYGPIHNDVAFGYVFLGSSLSRQELHEDAADAYLNAVRVFEAVNVPGHRATADAWRRLGMARLAQGRRTEAEEAFIESRRVYAVGFQAGVDTLEVGNDVAVIDTLIARILLDDNRREQAIDHLLAARVLASDSTLLAAVNATLDSIGEVAPAARARLPH